MIDVSGILAIAQDGEQEGYFGAVDWTVLVVYFAGSWGSEFTSGDGTPRPMNLPPVADHCPAGFVGCRSLRRT